MNRKLSGTHRRAYRRSIAPIEAMDRFFSRLGQKIKSSRFGRAVCGYGKLNAIFSERVESIKKSRKRATIVLKLTKYRLSRVISESRVLHRVSAFADKLMMTSLRSYGVFGMTFAAFSALVHFVKVYAIQAIQAIQGDLIFAGIVALLSLPLLFSRLPLKRALFQNPICARLLTSRLGFRRVTVSGGGRSGSQYTVPLIVGMVLGILGFFVRPMYIFCIIGTLVFCYVIFIAPEAAYLVVMFALPLMGYVPHPTAILCVFTLLAGASFVFKVIMGKRIFNFELLDLFVALFALLMLLGGVFTAGGKVSLENSIVYGFLLLGYFTVTNLFANESGVRRCSKMLVGGAVWVAFIALVEQISGAAVNEWLDRALFSFIDGRVTSSYDNPNMLAVFLTMVLPFSLALMFDAKGVVPAVKYFVSSAVIIAALTFTWSRGAWLAAIGSLVIFLICYSPKFLPLVVLVSATLPLVAHLLPQSIVARFVSITNFADSSISYRFDLWEGCLAMIKDHLLGGIGVGESAFGAVYPQYALSGIESAMHSHNLIMQILIELGLFGLAVFALMLLLYFQNALSYRSCEFDGRLRIYNIAAASSVIAVLIGGLTDHIWYNFRNFALFFIIFALGAAIGRANRRALAIPKYVSDEVEERKISASIDLYIE